MPLPPSVEVLKPSEDSLDAEIPDPPTYLYRWTVVGYLQPPETAGHVSVSFHCFSDDINAFGAFAAGQNTDVEPIAGAPAAYWKNNRLHLWNGSFLVNIEPSADAGIPRMQILELVEAVAERRPPPEQLSLFLRILPSGRRIQRTSRYVPERVLGVDFLHDGLTAQYLQKGDPLTLAVLRHPDEAAARDTLTRLVASLGGEEPAAPVRDLGQEGFSFAAAHWGTCLVMRQGPFVGLAVQVNELEVAEVLLRITATSIRISRFLDPLFQVQSAPQEE